LMILGGRSLLATSCDLMGREESGFRLLVPR
jgi:hypothetical protein